MRNASPTYIGGETPDWPRAIVDARQNPVLGRPRSGGGIRPHLGDHLRIDPIGGDAHGKSRSAVRLGRSAAWRADLVAHIDLPSRSRLIRSSGSRHARERRAPRCRSGPITPGPRRVLKTMGIEPYAAVQARSRSSALSQLRNLLIAEACPCEDERANRWLQISRPIVFWVCSSGAAISPALHPF